MCKYSVSIESGGEGSCSSSGKKLSVSARGLARDGLSANGLENKANELDGFTGQVIDTIIVYGNERTKRRAVIREMASKKGERIDPDLIKRDSSYLKGMGYFSSVDISVENIIENRCRVIVKVDERPNLFMKYPYPVLDYHFKEGIRYGVRWRIKNFRGLGEKISASFKKRRDKEHGGSASWFIPWVFGKRMRLRFDFFNYRRLDEPEYADFIKEKNGVRFSLGLPLTKDLVEQIWLTPTISMEARNSRLSIPEGTYYRQNILTLGMRLTYDSRNTWIVPTEGVYARVNLKHVLSVNGLDQEYSFFSFSTSNFTSFGKMGTLILAVRADNYEGSLPGFYEMKLGGNSDLRGYSEDMRGTAKILGTVQWRKNIYGPNVFEISRIGKFDLSINAIAFIDTGALSRGFEYFNTSIFHSTFGGGIEVLSPIQDIVRFEIASDRHGHSAFYLTSGTKF
ncbi:MAG: BamA/TamA family outer membrane protein [Candidatus Krumholzibacteriota bacterium]|nr:BamA/TamA family outer membrane protein [Candidatus Krumholzibacteriota bacterium]